MDYSKIVALKVVFMHIANLAQFAHMKYCKIQKLNAMKSNLGELVIVYNEKFSFLPVNDTATSTMKRKPIHSTTSCFKTHLEF